MKKLFISLFFLVLFLMSAFALPDANPTVRVGLYYGSNALPSANLQNIVGSGYRFGFFDSAKTFISQYSISGQNRISMLKDKNLYFSDGTFYESGQPSGSKLIGAFHIELTNTYNSASELSNQVTSLNMRGIPAFAAFKNGTYKIRIGTYATLAAAQADITKYISLGDGVPVGDISNCVTVISTADGSVLFEYENSASLAVYPSVGEVAMPLTWFKGTKYYGGFRYSRSGGNISVVNYVPMQEYLKGVVPSEMSSSWNIEALKAQAMCARTYAYYNFGKHGSDFDLCASSDCQTYSGANSASSNSDAAVDQTYGAYILYDNKPINAVFHSSDGGATEDSENIWSSKVPYLRGVVDNNENLDTCTNGRWTFEYTPAELTWILNAKGYPNSGITDMYVKEFTRMGNVKTLTLVDSSGKVFDFSNEKAKTILYSSTYKKYAYSQRFTVSKKGESASSALYVNNPSFFVDPAYDSIFAVGSNGVSQIQQSSVTIITSSGKSVFSADKKTSVPSSAEKAFIVSGTGWGHNVGMSQNGARALAEKGKTADDIIHFYYTDVEIYRAS